MLLEADLDLGEQGCEEAPDALFFTAELAKPFLLLCFARIVVTSIIYRINILMFLGDALRIVVFYLLILYVYGKFVRYGVNASRFYIVFQFSNFFGIKYRREMFIKPHDQIEYFVVTHYSSKNASVSFKSKTPGAALSGESHLLKAPVHIRRGMAWLFFTMPIGFGFYGIKNNGCISSYFSRTKTLTS